MDRLDFRILGAIFGQGTWRFVDWDPRISTREIAKRVGLAPSTVWERLREWERSGFLQGYGVLPNPRLLNARMVSHNVELRNVAVRDPFVRAVEGMDGLIGFFHHVGAWVSVTTFDASPEESARRSQMLADIAGVRHVEPPHALPDFAPRGRAPDARDWRILRSFVARPGGSFASIARDSGVSERAAKRRYERMIRDRLVWLFPFLDFSRVKGVIASIIVRFDPKVGYAALTNAMKERYPDALRLGEGIESPEGEAYPLWQGLWALDNIGEAEGLSREILTLPGGEDVEITYPLRLEGRGSWLLRHVDRMIESK